MEPQQRPFDEARLVKPGEWDALANFDENAVTEMEKAVDDEFARMKAQVEQEKKARKAERKAARATTNQATETAER